MSTSAGDAQPAQAESYRHDYCDPDQRGRLTALRAAWLFDGTSSSMIRDPVVTIDGATIVAVDSGGPAPAGADVVDLGGAALLPGLVDTHVHLAFDASIDPVGQLAAP